MPKQTRWAIKQGMDAAVNNLDWAQKHLITEGQRFDGVHDDYFQKFALLVQGIEAIKKAVIELKDSI